MCDGRLERRPLRFAGSDSSAVGRGRKQRKVPMSVELRKLLFRFGQFKAKKDRVRRLAAGERTQHCCPCGRNRMERDAVNDCHIRRVAFLAAIEPERRSHERAGGQFRGGRSNATGESSDRRRRDDDPPQSRR